MIQIGGLLPVSCKPAVKGGQLVVVVADIGGGVKAAVADSCELLEKSFFDIVDLRSRRVKAAFDVVIVVVAVKFLLFVIC